MPTRTADDDRDHELRELAHREHLLAALQVALADGVATYTLVHAAPDHRAAVAALRERHGFDDLQCDVVLDTQVRFATADARARIDEDLAELRRQRVDLESR